MWHKLISSIPSMKILLCAVLAWAIPLLVYTVNQRLHRTGDPPWKLAQTAQAAAQASGAKTSGGQASRGQTNGGQASGGQTNDDQASGGQTNGGQTNGGQPQQAAHLKDAGGESKAEANEQP